MKTKPTEQYLRERLILGHDNIKRIASEFDMHAVTLKKHITFLKIDLEEKYHKVPSNEQMSLIVGSLLGDASIMFISKFPRLQFEQCSKQSEYCFFKHKVLENLCKESPKLHIHKNSKLKKNYASFMFRTMQLSFLSPVVKLLYVGKQKIVTQNYLDFVDDFALAIWLCDDGCLKYKGNFRYTCFELATNSFGLQGNLVIKKWFEDKYALKPSLTKAMGKDKYTLRFNYKDDIAFLGSIIKKYNISGMDHKIYEQ